MTVRKKEERTRKGEGQERKREERSKRDCFIVLGSLMEMSLLSHAIFKVLTNSSVGGVISGAQRALAAIHKNNSVFQLSYKRVTFLQKIFRPFFRNFFLGKTIHKGLHSFTP